MSHLPQTEITKKLLKGQENLASFFHKNHGIDPRAALIELLAQGNIDDINTLASVFSGAQLIATEGLSDQQKAQLLTPLRVQLRAIYDGYTLKLGDKAAQPTKPDTLRSFASSPIIIRDRVYISPYYSQRTIFDDIILWHFITTHHCGYHRHFPSSGCGGSWGGPHAPSYGGNNNDLGKVLLAIFLLLLAFSLLIINALLIWHVSPQFTTLFDELFHGENIAVNLTSLILIITVSAGAGYIGWMACATLVALAATAALTPLGWIAGVLTLTAIVLAAAALCLTLMQNIKTSSLNNSTIEGDARFDLSAAEAQSLTNKGYDANVIREIIRELGLQYQTSDTQTQGQIVAEYRKVKQGDFSNKTGKTHQTYVLGAKSFRLKTDYSAEPLAGVSIERVDFKSFDDHKREAEKRVEATRYPRPLSDDRAAAAAPPPQPHSASFFPRPSAPPAENQYVIPREDEQSLYLGATTEEDPTEVYKTITTAGL